MPKCNECGGTVIEYDMAAGNGFCAQCGTVVEENTIVNEVSFGETSGGAAMVHGSYVGQGATRARMGGPFGNRGGGESREQTIANATRKIQNIAGVLRLSEVVCLSATRMYTLAVEHKFTKGRKSMNVVAVCLYVACRQKETRNYMLIDFSDLLQVNVFELGHIYLQLVQTLNLRLPLVDPSHYISRFAALLEFGDETSRVATDAVRLVQRFDRDWMTRGRRPAGLCGAALLLAARMNNFRRSVEEIVQVVKIADTTLRKRLEEFRGTASAQMTVGDFREVWLEEEMDPPAFTKGREVERAALEREEEGDGTDAENDGGKNKRGKKGKTKKKLKKSGKGKRKRDTGGDEDVEEDATPAPQPVEERIPIDPELLNQGILASETIEPENNTLPPALPTPPPSNEFDETVNAALTEEVSAFLENTQGSQLQDALDEAEARRLAEINAEDELLGLDEEELDRFILTEDEVKIKERVWVEINRDYLEALAAKGDLDTNQRAASSKSRKRRKTNSVKSRDASTPAGSTAAESVQNLLKQNRKYSKRINYEALKDLFVDSNSNNNVGTSGPGDDDKEDEEGDDFAYTMDADKSDGENGPMVVIEESVPLAPRRPDAHGGEAEDDWDGDDDYGGDGGWDDGYEQEV